MRPVFRFAPSPNGELHLGHAYSALLNAKLADESGGRFLLRIEDVDLARCRPEFEAAIYRDLAWLGLAWEAPVRRQSEHFPLYRSAIDRLIAEELVYPAFMSRGEIRDYIAEHCGEPGGWPRDPDGAPLYPDRDRRLPPAERRRRIAGGAPFAWRLDMAEAAARIARPLSWLEYDPADARGRVAPAEPERWGDVVLGRRDAPASYHLAVTLDDALQGVTDVVRGLDIFHATSVHRLLQELLGLPAPVYRHHRLLTGPDGRKLSKSNHDAGIASLRREGCSPREVRRMCGFD
jgi:glutamyl-Q tRNA(Asp) synthetase